MVFEIVGIAAFAFIVLIVVPFWMVSFIRRPYGSLARGKSTAAIGNALQDVDRLLARPLVEHKIELEQKVHKRDNDIGGD